MKKEIKPTRIIKNVYIVQNFGHFRDLFYSYKEARRYVNKEGTTDGGKTYFYQIYKCREIVMKGLVEKRAY